VLSNWNPIQSGELHPLVSKAATADKPRPNRRASTRNRPWNAGSSFAYRRTYQRCTSSRYPCSDGGDSGPSKYRMSMTTSGPWIPDVRRMMPSGSRNRAVPACGVTQPWTQSIATAPCFGGGDANGEGGATGDVATEVGGTAEADGGDAGGELDDGSSPPPPLHAASSNDTDTMCSASLRVITGAPDDGLRGYRPEVRLVGWARRCLPTTNASPAAVS